MMSASYMLSTSPSVAKTTTSPFLCTTYNEMRDEIESPTTRFRVKPYIQQTAQQEENNACEKELGGDLSLAMILYLLRVRPYVEYMPDVEEEFLGVRCPVLAARAQLIRLVKSMSLCS